MNHLDVTHATTKGTFSLDGGTWEVDNNVWFVGDDDECVVIDAAHDRHVIDKLIAGRRLLAVLCTHAHDDHIDVAQQISEEYDAPIRLHPADEPLWRMTYPDLGFSSLFDGDVIAVGGAELTVLHTPGHSPGAVCYSLPALGRVFTGDTLFAGGPGATGRSFSDFDTIIDSIRDRLLPLPASTIVHTGHGPSTTIGDEAPHLAEWIARGH